MRVPYTYEQAVAAFWAKVDVKGPQDCWLWKGRRDPEGYGKVNFQGRTLRVHRLAFFLSGGLLTEDQNACHTCDNPPCCNPSHLFAGTQKQNVDDCVNKGRKPKGSNHWKHKLTEELVAELRRDWENGMGCRKLARKYGISLTNVKLIQTGKAWKHAL